MKSDFESLVIYLFELQAHIVIQKNSINIEVKALFTALPHPTSLAVTTINFLVKGKNF